MIFKIDTLIDYISAGMTLRPGDIISTGTPEGGRSIHWSEISEGWRHCRSEDFRDRIAA